ncbi:hypothetical protein K474DRAFT_68395 [Panus rudis PR-1116 ss-1]|nr:hypothetical protein K474DRAFT_68395 [Panus rudis PR-1116 ss-1]
MQNDSTKCTTEHGRYSSLLLASDITNLTLLFFVLTAGLRLPNEVLLSIFDVFHPKEMGHVDYRKTIGVLVQVCMLFKNMLQPSLFREIIFSPHTVTHSGRQEWLRLVQADDTRATELAALVEVCVFVGREPNVWQASSPRAELDIPALRTFACQLTWFPNIRRLKMKQTRISPDVLRHLAQWPRLTDVKLKSLRGPMSRDDQVPQYNGIRFVSHWTTLRFVTSYAEDFDENAASHVLRQVQPSILQLSTFSFAKYPSVVAAAGSGLRELILHVDVGPKYAPTVASELCNTLEHLPLLRRLCIHMDLLDRGEQNRPRPLARDALPHLEHLCCPHWVAMDWGLVKGRPLRSIELITRCSMQPPRSPYTPGEALPIFQMLNESAVGITHLLFPFVEEEVLLAGPFPESLTSLVLEPHREISEPEGLKASIPEWLRIHTNRIPAQVQYICIFGEKRGSFAHGSDDWKRRIFRWHLDAQREIVLSLSQALPGVRVFGFFSGFVKWYRCDNPMGTWCPRLTAKPQEMTGHILDVWSTMARVALRRQEGRERERVDSVETWGWD